MLLIVSAAIAGGLIFLLYNQDYFQETTSKLYKDRLSAESSGAISNRWLPEFLPQSAFDIHEKHNIDYGTGIIKFSLPPSKIQIFVSSLQPMPQEDFANSRPVWVYRSEKWFPNSIVKGTFEELENNGFKLYWLNEGTRHSKDRRWFVAINPETGVVCIWNRNQ